MSIRILSRALLTLCLYSVVAVGEEEPLGPVYGADVVRKPCAFF
jgi:hypothetical protein